MSKTYFCQDFFFGTTKICFQYVFNMFSTCFQHLYVLIEFCTLPIAFCTCSLAPIAFGSCFPHFVRAAADSTNSLKPAPRSELPDPSPQIPDPRSQLPARTQNPDPRTQVPQKIQNRFKKSSSSLVPTPTNP